MGIRVSHAFDEYKHNLTNLKAALAARSFMMGKFTRRVYTKQLVTLRWR